MEGEKPLRIKRLAHSYYSRAGKVNCDEIRSRFLMEAYALAVSENNGAATHDVVTTPTCGACGILPAVLYYYYKHKISKTIPAPA